MITWPKLPDDEGSMNERSPAEAKTHFERMVYRLAAVTECGVLLKPDPELAGAIGGIPRLDRPVSNALIVAQTVHARAVIGFLDGDPNRAKHDDVIAVEFVPDWNWTKAGRHLLPIKRRINKEIAHATTDPPIGKEWRIHAIPLAVSNAFGAFLEEAEGAIPPDLCKKAWEAMPDVVRNCRGVSGWDWWEHGVEAAIKADPLAR